MKHFLPLLFSVLIILLLFFYSCFRVFEFSKPFLPFAPYLLGSEKPTSYLVLLGNDAEMRANGGFAGSYAKLKISSTHFDSLSSRVFEFFLENPIPKPSMELDFQDIYVPNGQIAGQFVKPPLPIQQAFGHGTWELANADWEPDFPSAAKTIRWFMEKGREINPDNLVILNLSTIKKILNVIGSFPVPTYHATLTPDNLYLFLQGKAELNFFPGSTQKKDALTAVGHALLKKAKSLSLLQKLKIAQILYEDFQNQNLLIHSNNSDFQNFLIEKNLAGVLQPEALDTYSMIETNLGANKANAYVTRQTAHTVSVSSNNPIEKTIHHSVIIHLQNSSLAANPNPPFDYGGNYIAYIRLYISKDAQNIQLSHQDASSSASTNLSSENLPAGRPGYDLRSIYGLTEIGFWHTTLAGNESTINLTYDLPLPDPKAYTLAILKQHGLVTSPQTINLFGTTQSTPLNHSLYFP